MINKIPEAVREIIIKLQEKKFEAYIVGGCVRDLLMNKIPKDWDIATNAKPEEVMKIFPDSFYENEFGTVGIKIKNQKSPKRPVAHGALLAKIKNTNQNSKFNEENNKNNEEITEVVEVTTFRIESKYSDKRHPDGIKFAKTLEEDLSRRDFTVNAMAFRITHNAKHETQDEKRSTFHAPRYEIIDLFGGQKDLENKIIKAVGDSNERFNEDALRMLRAVRFYVELGFAIEENTLEAVKRNAKNLKFISQERIKDELKKIILSEKPSEGIEMLHETKLLEYIIPELEKGYGIKQNRHHVHTIFKHNLLSLKFCPSQKLEVRLAALLHDIAKPQTKRGEGEYATFYNHDHVGARVAEKILMRLRFSNDIVKKVKLLIDNHMFYYNVEEVGESSVRRLIQKVGLENMKDLIDLRMADRLGSGVPKAKPYKLRHLEYMIDKVSRDAVSVKMLKINGHDLMKELKLKPGPKIGTILDVLLAEVIEDAKKNDKKYLLERAGELDKEDIDKLRQMAKVRIKEKKEEDDKELKGRHWVK